jgi:hypothetical protein
MSWFGKSPFGRDEDPVKHMLELLCTEAEKAGTPLTDQDQAILASERSELAPVPDDLRQKTKKLIARMLEAESYDEFEWDPKSFGFSLQWVSDSTYPNLVDLTEEVSGELRGTAYPRPRGWKLYKDRMLLIGSGLLVVFLMLAISSSLSLLFGWK